MRILRPTFALVLGLALAPAVALAQNSSVPPNNPSASITAPSGTTAGTGANASRPVGGPGLTEAPHVKTHKRAHKHMYGKHYNVMKHSKGTR
ncbi:hypothetical protein [Acidisoma cladoniae]|jgi:hypothetical protein|uniref:hypothetical protein n=1 Tax=Acidisoma cladoniae TaxID=3040935 RepID=UPI00254CD3A0|nr:hypothetical protein [Acidisoma sp. PAMC 29798]